MASNRSTYTRGNAHGALKAAAFKQAKRIFPTSFAASGKVLRVGLLLLVMSLAMPLCSVAQNKKPRKTLREILLRADSLRLLLRQSADKGHMLQWGDSLVMEEVRKSNMSEKKKQKFMARYAKRRMKLERYDKLLFRGDSLLAANYRKVKYDTAYITRPDARWTVKFNGNLSGAHMETRAKTEDATNRTRLLAEFRGTLSMAVAYRGLGLSLAVNPAKLVGKSKDYELNLNSYSNRYGFDVVYLASKTYHGHQEMGGERIDIDRGQVSQKALNLNFYYAFNHRRFSFPAAFSQSYIQRRSAGSWMVGASFDGSKTTLGNTTIRLNEFAVGAGYGYNLVARPHWLFHLSALPTLTVYSHDYTKQTQPQDASDEDAEPTTERTNMKYHFPSAIVTCRGAVVYSWRNKFMGARAIYNYSVAGDDDHLQVMRNKWRVRAFFGFRF